MKGKALQLSNNTSGIHILKSKVVNVRYDVSITFLGHADIVHHLISCKSNLDTPKMKDGKLSGMMHISRLSNKMKHKETPTAKGIFLGNSSRASYRASKLKLIILLISKFGAEIYRRYRNLKKGILR